MTDIKSGKVCIAVLLTCFNRQEKTLEFLRALDLQMQPETAEFFIVLVDDGSTDGTTEAVQKEFPSVIILHGNGSLYWCGGMRLAWGTAALRNPDYYLAANDDTLLDPTAIHDLLSVANSCEAFSIVVGAIRDPTTGKATYGGWRNKYGVVSPTGLPQFCDTFNANCVLIPRSVYLEMGVFHSAFQHAMGDFDYGFQAVRRGITIVQTPDFVGTCPHNSTSGTWRDKSLSRSIRMRLLQSPKGLPWRQWLVYNWRNAGWVWPYRTISPFLRILLGK